MPGRVDGQATGKRVLSFLLALLRPVALIGSALPLLLFFTTPPFRGRLFFTVLFVCLALEKTWAMFWRMRDRYVSRVEQDWTTVAVGYSYTLTMYLIVVEYYLHRRGVVNPYLTALGLAGYAAALSLRYWAFAHLGHQWSIHLDEEIADRRLVTSGPYRFIRHPLYLSACVELVSIAVAFNSFLSLGAAVLVFVPFEVHRAYFEERYLAGTFGAEYEAYRAVTWAFFPRPVRKPAASDL